MRANFQSHDRNLWREEREEGRKEALEGGGLPEFGAIEIFEFGGGREGGRVAASPDCVAPPSSYAEGEREFHFRVIKQPWPPPLLDADLLLSLSRHPHK